MDIRMQCCGIILLLVLLYFYRQQKKIFLNTERAFFRTFMMTLLCVTLDILSVVVLDHRAALPELFVKFICKSYVVSLVLVAWRGLLYVCVDIYDRQREYRRKARKYGLVALVGTVLIYTLPIQYHFAEDGTTILYTEGPSVITTYIFAVAFLIMNFRLMKKEKSRINPKRREAVQLWMGVWCAAAVIQFIDNRLLLVGYMSTVGIMILYLKLENPESNLDRQSGMFDHNALMRFIRQVFGKEQRVSVLVIVLQDSLYENRKYDRSGSVNMEVIEYLLHIADALVFKNMENEIVLVFENSYTAEAYVQRISQRFQEGWGSGGRFYVKHRLIYMPDTGIIDTAEDMFYLLGHIRQSSMEASEGRVILADRTRVEEMYRRRETEKLLELAIEKDLVEVYYQPIFSTKEKRFTSAEALVRIRDLDGKIVPPGVFIGIAEQNGSILSLGKIVFEKVCQMMKQQDVGALGLHYIEVNLSVVQCAYEQLAEDYIGVMQKYEVPAEGINLEITESASLEAKTVLLNNMERLMKFGTRFSLDDFGTGQSNLNYIVDMPVDIVKFDKDMTTAYFENSKARYVMESAINMIHGMGLEIVSEGIETAEQYRTMEELGISYIQGYYFSKPLPEAEFLAFMRAHNSGAQAE